MTISAYIERKNKIEYETTFRITPEGKGYYLEDGKLLSRREFAQMYPLPISLVMHNKKNADGLKSYLMVD